MMWRKRKLGWDNSDETGQHHVTVMGSPAVLLDGISLRKRHEHRRETRHQTGSCCVGTTGGDRGNKIAIGGRIAQVSTISP
jgi:hypothetical protein